MGELIKREIWSSIAILWGLILFLAPTSFFFKTLILTFILLGAISYVKPEAGFIFVLFTIPFSKYVSVNFLGKINYLHILILPVFLVFALLIWKKRKKLRWDNKLLFAYLGFLLLYINSVVFTKNISLQRSLMWLEFGVMLFFSINLLTIKKLKKIIYYCLIFGAILGVLGLVQHYAPLDSEINKEKIGKYFDVGDKVRAYGTFGQPNPFAYFLNMSIPFSLLLMWNKWERGKKWGIILFIILTMGMFSTVSRTAMLSFFIGMLLISSIGLKQKIISRKEVFLLILLILISMVPFLIDGSLSKRIPLKLNKEEKTDYSLKQRIAGTKAGVEMVKKDLLIGIGAGNYAEEIDKYAYLGLDHTYLHNHLHNLYLQIWSENGIIVLGAFLMLILIFFIDARNRLKKEKNQEKKLLLCLSVGAVIIFLMSNLFDFFLVRGMYLFLTIILAVPYTIRELTKRKKKKK